MRGRGAGPASSWGGHGCSRKALRRAPRRDRTRRAPREERVVMRQYRIAAIPADGIGKEVIAAGLSVLAALEARDGGFRLEGGHFPWGSDYYRKAGRTMAGERPGRLKGC